jgi:hypothetical protein
VTEPAPIVVVAVTFQPVSVLNGSNILGTADPVVRKLPLIAVSPESQLAIELIAVKLLVVEPGVGSILV